jgi:hypothetical protein
MLLSVEFQRPDDVLTASIWRHAMVDMVELDGGSHDGGIGDR